MYLNALEIQGFKSFPDKTVLNFGEDITAIVGPNGSGKSNISDAIRWVMGEQSSRSLRGAKMEDVIFGGTEKRNQMGFAQVTLVIDNTENIFNMDESEVAITRRYYRSGESEYYINKQSVRLRDINELFMDTGMGKEGYSIIGQGRIDEILSVKSGERREVFEEAAGISKFRHRKEDAERKMQKTEENLVRINDKIAELELQVEPLRDQAEKAKKYLVLRDELRVLEISVWLENLQSIKTNSFKLEADLAAAEEELKQAQANLDEQYAATERFGRLMQENDLAAEQLRAEIAALEAQISECEAAAAVLRANMENNSANLSRMEAELADQENRSGNLFQQMEDQRRRMGEIDAEEQKNRDDLDALIAKAEEAARSVGDAADEMESLRGKEALCVAAAAEAKAELSALQAGIAQMNERKAAIGAEKEAAETALAENEKKAKTCRRELEDAQDEADAINNMINGHALKMEGRRRKAEETAEKKLQLTMDHGALLSRIHLLSEMEKDYEGFNKAVKAVMQAAEKNVLRGIHAPVAQLMSVDKKHAVALEIALGAGMQNIVVDKEEDGKAAINYLKQRESGRATFLPLTAIRGEELKENGVSGEYGFVGIASELVRFDKKYTEIFRNLLGRTVIVEDMDCGIAISRKYNNRFRIVTLDGQVINRGGSMTGGSISRSAGILSRANELQELQNKKDAMEAALLRATQEADGAKQELTKAEYELSVAESQKHQAEEAVVKLQSEKNHFDILCGTIRESLENMDAEAESIVSRVAEHEAKAKNCLAVIASKEAECEALRREAEEKAAGQTSLNEQRGAVADEIGRVRAAMAALSAEKEATQRALQELQKLHSDMQGDQESRLALMENYRAENEKLAAEVAGEDAKSAQMRQEQDAIKTRLSTLSQEKLSLEAQRTANDKNLREVNDTLLNVQNAVSRLEQKKAACAMEEKQILDKLWERYELSHSAATEQRIELESIPKATRRIGELNRDIKALGTPNIGAIEEYDRVNTRYTYLSEQRDDVEKAKEELQGVIEDITREMTAIFSQQFKLLNESFQETFLELFGGGKAQLELEDENDILNCGIEIKVQPPGKTLKTITLLSGGEKAFVAIALYFSILKVHPTPFCVMDEIEAALDEANVVRYAKYMRRIAGKTQFIVITHRRGTMEEADVLYGVTMQERGVSKMLTINLNDMSKELNIK